jgi:hypothetical protein
MPSNVDLRVQGPRHHHTAQTSYLDETFLVGTPLTTTPGQPVGTVVPGANATYNFLIGYLPAGARILRATIVTGLAIAGGTGTLQLGTTSGGNNLSATAVLGTAGLVSIALTATAALYVNTEATAVWAQIVTTAGTITALQSDVIVEYATVHGPQSQF